MPFVLLAGFALAAQGQSASSFEIENVGFVDYKVGTEDYQDSDNEILSVRSKERTPSTIIFYKYAPTLTTGVINPDVATTSYRDGSGGPLAPLDPPVNQPVPLVPVNLYHSGEPIFLTLEDQDQNLLPGERESVLITLTVAETGDEEVLRLVETGPDTGVFAGYIPSTGAPATTFDGELSLTNEAQIVARYVDPVDGTDVSSAAALIDPFGIVFDSSTGDPIDGATVAIVNDHTGLPATVFGDDGQSSYPSSVISGQDTQDSNNNVYPMLPSGFRYQDGSAYLEKQKIDDPQISGDQLHFGVSRFLLQDRLILRVDHYHSLGDSARNFNESVAATPFNASVPNASSANSNNPNGDYDIFYQFALSNDDYIIMTERNGNSTISIQALDADGNRLPGSNEIIFQGGGNSAFQWDTGYRSSEDGNNNQTQELAVIDISLFNTNDNIFGLRVINNSGADNKILVASDDAFDNNVPNPNGSSLPVFTVLKSAQVNNGSDPDFYLPGSRVVYQVSVTNSGEGSPDPGTFTFSDDLPDAVELFVGDFEGAGGPIRFIEGSEGSDLDFSQANVVYRNASGGAISPGSSGYNPNIASFEISFPAPDTFDGWDGTGAQPSFTVRYEVRIKE